MSFLASSEEATKRRIFFSIVLGTTNGYVCIARRPYDKPNSFYEEFFEWPSQQQQMEDYIVRFTPGNDIWFCSQLLSRTSRTKDAVILCPNAWADLDSCHYSKLSVKPTIVVESSSNRFQAYWLFDEPQQPLDAEDISRRIAYRYADDGCDKSGWDLTQLLRVPFTYNFKYGGFGEAPRVEIVITTRDSYDLADFSAYPEVAEYKSIAEAELPTEIEDSEDLLMRYRSALHPMAYVLWSRPPKQDWSKALWSLELLLFESGLKLEEVFAVVRDAACNKYERDHRGDETLWKEVVRAEQHHIDSAVSGISVKRDDVEPLLTDIQRAAIEPTIIEDYISWASGLGDAASQYHQAGAFTILSALLSATVRIPTSFGTVKPNLWFMILADTTLTRKTTAMDLAMDLLNDFDGDAILATDGSIEGLFSALSTRPNRPSIFLRDEFSGLLDAMTRKDYMAGMAESLTKLYDGKMQKRILRKETIEVKDPILILFTGGIRSRILELLSEEHVVSGFLPRFCFICADADITKLKPVGPPTVLGVKERERITTRLQEIHNHYTQIQTITIDGNTTVTQKIWNAELTEEAWVLYNQFEAQMVNFGLYHPQRDMVMPSLDRLAKSGLKAALLIAAVRNLGEKIVITEQDMIHAFYYVEIWRSYMFSVLENIGKSQYERMADLITREVDKVPGIKRGTLMRQFKLASRQTDEILNTLEERYLIKRVKNGKSESIYPPDTSMIHVNMNGVSNGSS